MIRHETLLEVKNLSVNINRDGENIEVLKNISYKLFPSETLAIVGESGSGKTLSALSIIRLLPNCASIISGEIIYRGEDLAAMPEERLRKFRGSKISMIFQEPMTSLNPVMTIGRQIAETITTHKNLSYKDALARSAALLEKAGITDAKRRLDEYPHNFSGGMRQRVMTAIALSCGPDIVIADEPTTALDVTVQARILELISKLRKESGMSMILITHNLGIVARHADYVLVFYAGKIMERAPAAEIFKNPAHPYTEALLDSLPRINKETKRLRAISGTPPDFSSTIRGCPFHPRCPRAFDKCRIEEPPEFMVSDAHGSKCWLRENAA